MASRFRRRERPADGVRRIARGFVATALATVADPALTPDEAVHVFRQTGKRLRALLRLVGPHLAARRQLDRGIAEAIGGLSSLRDADVILRTYADLLKRADVMPDVNLQGIFATRRLAMSQHVGEQLAEAVAGLSELGVEASTWEFDAHGFALLEDGLTTTRARLRKATKRAAAAPGASVLHAWRKQVKYLQYGLELLRNAAPGRYESELALAHALAEALGAHHDLEMLRTAVVELQPPDRDQLGHLIDARQAELAANAFGLGDQLTAALGPRFVWRLRRHWRHWRARGG